MFVQAFLAIGKYLRQAGIVLLASLLLSGCVKYDVGVNFNNPNRGEIVQHIKLGERLTSFSGEQAQEWLNSIQRRVRQLQGTTKRLSNQEITVTIPFNNGAELEAKFNEFFNPSGKRNSDVNNKISDLPDIESQLRLNQNNLLLLLRNRLRYDLDLRSLSLISTNGSVLIEPGDILDLEFSLNTPWGARSIESNPNAASPESYKKGRQLVWKLQSGQLYHIEAVFWLPSPLGIGAVLIGLFVIAGAYLRYKFMPDPKTQYPHLSLPETP